MVAAAPHLTAVPDAADELAATGLRFTRIAAALMLAEHLAERVMGRSEDAIAVALASNLQGLIALTKRTED